MAFNGSGVFNRLYNWVQDASNNIQIMASRMDNETQGIADGLTNCITRDGQSPPTADLPMGGKKMTGLASGATSSDAVNYGQTVAALAAPGGAALVSFLQSGSGAQVTTTQDTLRNRGATVKEFGATGLGIASDSAPILAALLAHGDVYVPAGTYKISSIISATLTKNVKLTLAPNAYLVADAAIGSQMFRIDGSSTYSFEVEGGVFDVSAVPNPGAGGDVGTVFDLNLLKRWSAKNSTFIAGTDFRDVKGDTAIDAVSCGPGLITNCWFYGFYDNGIYLTGGSSTGPSDDGGPTVITGNYFYGCSTACGVKRKNPNVIYTANYHEKCQAGFGSYEVGAGEIQPGDRFIIANNWFVETVNRSIEFRGGLGKAQIVGNRIVDFGYNLDGTLGTSKEGMFIAGSNCVVADNWIGMDALANSNHTGITIGTYTIGPTTYTPDNNDFSGNTFKTLTNGIFEGASVGSCRVKATTWRSVTNPFTRTNAASMVDPYLVAVPVRTATIAFGTVNNAADGTVTLSTPGTLPGDVVNVYVHSAATYSPAAFPMRGRVTVADQTAVTVSNRSGGNYTFIGTDLFTVNVERYL